MTLVPSWLLRVPSGLDVIPKDWGQPQRDDAGDLTTACLRLAHGGVVSATCSWIRVAGVDLAMLDVSVPEDVALEPLKDPLVEAVEFISACRRDGAVLTTRTGFVGESGGFFARYVDRIANLPETDDLAALVPWLAIRCAEWRSKVAQLRSDVLAMSAAHERGGLPDGFDLPGAFARSLVSSILCLPEMQELDGCLQRASRDLEAADASLTAAGELLDAKASSMAQAAAERLQTTSTWIGIAVALAGFGAIGGLLFDGDKGTGLSMWTAVGLTVAPTGFALSAFIMLYWRNRKRRVTDPKPGSMAAVEAELNALCEGALERVWEMHHADVPLRERLIEAAVCSSLQAYEAEARGRLVRMLDDLRSLRNEIDVDSFAPPRQGSSSTEVRTEAVARLDRRSRATETAALVLAEIEISDCPMPDIGVAIWLHTFGIGMNPDRPIVIDALLHNVITRTLEGSPRVRASALAQVRRAVKGMFDIEADEERVLDEIAEAEGDLLKALKRADVEATLTALAPIRLSALAAAVRRESECNGEPDKQVDGENAA